MNSLAREAVWAFDAYGTLFDIHSAVRGQSEQLGSRAAEFAGLWRSKQLEYSWVRSLANAHADFWSCTVAALDFALAMHGLSDAALREALLEAYRFPAPYPDALPALQRLRAAGAQIAVLSNGTPGMLEAAISGAGLTCLFDAVLSVEEAGVFKPHRRVYELVTRRFEVSASAVHFCSANAWDIAGASAFGFATVWINRSGQPPEYGIDAAAAVVGSLDELPIAG
ncbi:MAG: haloacid dehalogenase type II [Bauldia sp.]